jgi:hypothetical protein
MNPRNRPAWTFVPPRDRMRKGTVGNNRKAERNVVKVNEQSRKNSGLKRAGRSEALTVVVLRMLPPNVICQAKHGSYLLTADHY